MGRSDGHGTRPVRPPRPRRHGSPAAVAAVKDKTLDAGCRPSDEVGMDSAARRIALTLAGLALAVAGSGCSREVTSNIPKIEARYPVVADLQLESADRTVFSRFEGRDGGLFNQPSGSGYSQIYVARDGHTADDVIDELLAVLEADGWGPMVPIGRFFCGDQPSPEDPELFDVVSARRRADGFDEPGASFSVRLGQPPCRQESG